MDKINAFPPTLTSEQMRSLHPLTKNEAAQLEEQISGIDRFDPDYQDKKLIITDRVLWQILNERTQQEGENNE